MGEFGTLRVSEKDRFRTKRNQNENLRRERRDPSHTVRIREAGWGKTMGTQQMELREYGERNEPRIDPVRDSPANRNGRTESLAELEHDARNMISALDLYCDLLQEPGVLTGPFSHYGGELKLVAAASRSLVEKLSNLHSQSGPNHDPGPAIAPNGDPVQKPKLHNLHAPRLENFARELLANRNILAAIAGPFVALTIDVEGGALPVQMTSEGLTRILVNLVKNSAEAMSSVGRIHISLVESRGEPADSSWLRLNVEDNGPGIPDRLLDTIFEPGQTTRAPRLTANCNTAGSGLPSAHRGLGLSITRSIVEAAGGRIHAANRDPIGACFQIELPVRNTAAENSRSERNRCDTELS